MERPTILATIKTWNRERQRYEPSKSYDITLGGRVEFGNLIISFEKKPPVKDPLDTSASLVLSKNPNEKGGKIMHVSELRKSSEKPKRYAVGKNILKKEPFFYFSNIDEVRSLKIFDGKPSESKHPDLLEFTPVVQIGEKGKAEQLA